MTLVTIISALLFVLSSGLLFNERYRSNKPLMTIAGLLALIASYFLLDQMIDAIITRRLQTTGRTNDTALTFTFYDFLHFWRTDLGKTIVTLAIAALTSVVSLYGWRTLRHNLQQKRRTTKAARRFENISGTGAYETPEERKGRDELLEELRRDFESGKTGSGRVITAEEIAGAEQLLAELRADAGARRRRTTPEEGHASGPANSRLPDSVWARIDEMADEDLRAVKQKRKP